MPKFEEYARKTDQHDRDFMKYDEATTSFQRDAGALVYGADQVLEKYQTRMDTTTLEQRTEYYFRDEGMLESKVRRYESISGNIQESESYAERYKNKNAAKRRKAAAEAGSAFKKAKEEISKFSEAGKNPFEIYSHRAKVMEYRLEGRLKAAEAKSTSDENEAFLKSRARLSCLTILLEQLDALSRQTRNAQLTARFELERATLEERLEAAREEVRNSDQSAARIWQNSRTAQDNLFDDNFKKSHKGFAKLNPDFSEDGLRALRTLEYMDQNKPDWPKRVVLKTAAGTCVTEGEKEKEAWNQRFDQEQDPKVKEDMIREALSRVENFPIPDLKTLSSMDLIRELNSHMSDYYDVLNVALPYLKSAKEGTPEANYIRDNPRFAAKLEALSAYSDYIDGTLRLKHGIRKGKDGKYGFVGKWDAKEIKIVSGVEFDATLAKIENLQMSYSTAYSTLNEIDLKKNVKSENFNEADYELYLKIKRNKSVFKTKNHIRKSYRALKERLKREGDIYDPRIEAPGFIRAVSVLLDTVNSKNKSKARKSNNDVLNILLSGNEKAINREITSKLSGMFDKIRIPSEKEISGGWFAKTLTLNPDDFLETLRKAECLRDLFEAFPGAMEFAQSNKSFAKKYEEVMKLRESFREYMIKNHGFDPGLGDEDPTILKELSEEEQDNLGMYKESEPLSREEFLDRIDENANKQKQKKKNKIGRKRRRKLNREKREAERRRLDEEYLAKLKGTVQEKTGDKDERKEDKEKDKEKDREIEKEKEKERQTQKKPEIEREREHKKDPTSGDEELARKLQEEEYRRTGRKPTNDDLRALGKESKLTVSKISETEEKWTYTNRNGRVYELVKKAPGSIQEAINLRYEVIKTGVYNNDPKVIPLFEHYDTYITDWLKDNDLATIVDPDYLELKDVTRMDFEQIGLERNKILNQGFLEKDLKGKVLEIYQFYSDAIHSLQMLDPTLNTQIQQHEARQRVDYRVSLDTNLDVEYERQVPYSNDCWSCAGVGIFNHFIRKAPDYEQRKKTQEQYRANPVEFVSQQEAHLDEESYQKRKSDVEDFTTKNLMEDRTQSQMGDPYVTADFYLKQFRDMPEFKNAAVRKSIFNFVAADSYVNGVKGSDGTITKDTNAKHNLVEQFKQTINNALLKDSAIAMLLGRHYVTIIGIDGDKLKIRDSNNLANDEITLARVTDTRRNNRPVELVWLEKITDPKAVADEFGTLEYDEEKKTFRTNERMRDVGSYEEEIAHKEGVGAWKTLQDKGNDIGSLVSEAIYLPKTFQS